MRASTRPGGEVADGFPDPHHDHGHCVASALGSAEAICVARGEKLTALRRQVLELVWGGHRPTGAYDILAAMQAQTGRKIAPPTVYRTLDFLQQQGLVHRIESLNAYVGCRAPGRPHDVQFMICRQCGTAVELDDRRVARALETVAGAAGFAIERRVVELSGRCARCVALPDASQGPASAR
jgi:Fur family zinc uptake transcriptional regulator